MLKVSCHNFAKYTASISTIGIGMYFCPRATGIFLTMFFASVIFPMAQNILDRIKQGLLDMESGSRFHVVSQNERARAMGG